MKLKWIIWTITLLHLSISETNGQNVIKGFFNLSGPERWWVLGHLHVAIPALKITKEAIFTTDSMLKNSALDQFSRGGRIDAFRHIYWMARLSQRIGEKKTRSLGVAHEKGNYKSFLKGKEEDLELPDSVSGVMDLHNNEIGIFIGKSVNHLSMQLVKEDVIKCIHKGDAVILKRNRLGQLITCEGEIVEMKDVWLLPLCLVNSNY